jgi:signal transduction histidine kinase
MFVRKDGTNVVVRCRPHEGRWTRLGELRIFRDVTDRKQLQAEVERAHRMDSLGRPAGGIAHDFNNLIPAFNRPWRWHTWEPATKSSSPTLSRERRPATARASDLTRQLLAFSRGGGMQASAVDPNQVVEETVGLLGLASDRLELELSLDPDAGKVWIDPSQLHQVVMNLLLNARDALRDRGRIRVATMRRAMIARSPTAGRASGR